MIKSTWGNPKVFKSLEFIEESIEKMDSSKKRKITKFISKWIENIYFLSTIESKNFKTDFLFHHIKNVIDSEIIKLSIFYDEKLISHIRNFIFTKFKIMKKSHRINFYSQRSAYSRLRKLEKNYTQVQENIKKALCINGDNQILEIKFQTYSKIINDINEILTYSNKY